MGILRRLFSIDYRRALAAEAQGDFLTAAKHYALCGERHKVADMHLAQAHAESRDEDRLQCLRSALLFLEPGDVRRPMVLRMAGRTLRDLASSESGDAEDRRQWLEEAAASLESGESWELAADCYLELGDPGRAASAYARAGLLERVEEVLGQQEREQDRLRREESCFRDYELHLQGGQRDQAAAALRTCIEAATQKGEYRRLLGELEQRTLSTGRLEVEVEAQRLLLIGRLPVLLGRDADCDLQARGGSVSRHHARVELRDGQLHVCDCDSRNGTLLGGLRLGAALPLPGSGTLALGEDCQLSFETGAGEPPALRLEVTRGLDVGRLAVVSISPIALQDWLPAAPDLEIRFERGRPLARARSGQLALNQALVSAEVQLLRGDSLELGGRSLRVVG